MMGKLSFLSCISLPQGSSFFSFLEFKDRPLEAKGRLGRDDGQVVVSVHSKHSTSILKRIFHFNSDIKFEKLNWDN
jgi:hypothetical protein